MTTAMAPGAVPLWVSIEGINGVGKTSAAQQSTAQNGPSPNANGSARRSSPSGTAARGAK